MLKVGFMEAPAPWLMRQGAQTALGLLYLATIVKEAGYEVKMLKPRKLSDLIAIAHCDVVCMGGTTIEYPMNVECARALKVLNPYMKIFIGGAHVTAFQSGTILNDCFDSMCVGEGEYVILHMLKDLEEGNLLLRYRQDGQIDVNKIPLPDRSLIDGSHGGDIFMYNRNYVKGGHENFITSRGCHHKCAFCASKTLWESGVRYRSIDSIEQEVKGIVEDTGIRQLRICDDNLIANRSRLKEICKIFKKYDMVWRCSARAESLSKEVCDILQDGGCKEVSLGIESGDQRVLDFLRKQTKVEKMAEGCANAVASGINVRALFMIGTPGEYKDTPEKNKEYLSTLNLDLITLSTFIPLPGTDIWIHPEKYNCRIVNRDFSKYNKDYYQSGEVRKYIPLIRNEFLTEEEQIDNVRRMEEYVINEYSINKG